MKKFWFFITVVVGLLLISYSISGLFGVEDFGDKIAVIPIKATITGEGSEDLFISGSTSSATSSTTASA